VEENAGQRGDYSKQKNLQIEKAHFCLVAEQACDTTKSPLKAKWRDQRPEQAKVKINGSSI